MSCFDKIDGIYCILSPEDSKMYEERFNHSIQLFSYLGLLDRVTYVKGLPLSERVDDGSQVDSANLDLVCNNQACFQDAVNHDYDTILIFEDDAFLDLLEFEPVLEDAFRIFDTPDFGMLYLGWSLVRDKIAFRVPNFETILKINGALCSHAIVYSKMLIKDMCGFYPKHLTRLSVGKKFIEKFKSHDNYLCNFLPPFYKKYIPIFRIFGQMDGYSGIRLSDVNHHDEDQWYDKFDIM